MTDLESEEIIEGPRVSSAFEFGGTDAKPRTRDNLWYRAFASDSEPTEGLIIKVGRRPRTKRNEDPHPTLRLMRENPNGMLYVYCISPTPLLREVRCRRDVLCIESRTRTIIVFVTD